MDEEQVCPRCKTTKYQNPSMKLMVNVCGHPLCEMCVNMLFAKGSGVCVQCDTPLRRSGFRVQLYEDSKVEKDLDIRRRILREFNKQEQDFDSLRDYNDYLEEVETIIYNLTNEIDVLVTNKKIEAYKRDNKEAIVRNRGRLRCQDEELDEILHVEEELERERRQLESTRQLELRQQRVQRREALIDELSSSHADAGAIVAQHALSSASATTAISSSSISGSKVPAAAAAAAAAAPACFSSGVRIGGASLTTGRAPTGAAISSSSQQQQQQLQPAPLFQYVAPQLPCDGPEPPPVHQLDSLGYLRHIRAASEADRAGGFTTSTGCMRALQEALAGLLFFQVEVTSTAAQSSAATT